MKFLNLALLCFCAYLVSADGGYAGHCKNITLVKLADELGLRAYCEASSGASQCNILSLDRCYGSDMGLIKSMDNGSMSKRCPLDRPHLNGTVLNTECHKFGSRKSAYVNTSIDTNQLIISDNGILGCFENRATTPHDCAQRTMSSSTDISRIPIVSAMCLCIVLIATLTI
ncbi:hypothetical protein F4806DRAFT_500041 [Annulohypoxylon nitens]|nr:hypothetical protein F4806DRAFT_500041 [Annulohypoxylon nitens]